MKQKEKDHPRGKCLYCVHCHLADPKRYDEDGERVYECLMIETELTYSHYALDCSQLYTGANE